MSMRNKLITAIVALSLVLCCLVGGTMAWLTASTATIENTFTYGDVSISLVETGATSNEGKFTKSIQMVPGNTIDKDPTVTVNANSEDCYLFVKINESENLDSFITYAIASGWTYLSGKDTTEAVIYREVTKSDVDQSFTIIGNKGFEGTGTFVENKVLVRNDVTKTMMGEIKSSNQPTLSFTAYAVQKANVDDAAAAWTIINP